MIVKIEPKDVENLAKGIGHEVELFLRNREIEEEEARGIGERMAASIEATIYEALGI